MNSNNLQKLIILTGPTGVGKTALSIDLAKELNCEIISADSMQVYRKMDIGSAKITVQEMSGITHHLIDIKDPKEEFSAYLFKEEAKKAIQDITSRNKLPLIVGGTGFYIQTLLQDIDFEEEDSNEIRNELTKIMESNGIASLYEELRSIDPASAEKIHPNNAYRVIRALEFYRMHGKPFSEFNSAQKEKEIPYNFACFVLKRNREEMYERINHRVDEMIDCGLVDEVKELKAYGCLPHMTSMQGLGYKEILKYLNGDCDLEAAINEIKTSTRHFAKRQLTWFNSKDYVNWIDYKDYESNKQIIDYIKSVLKEKDIIC